MREIKFRVWRKSLLPPYEAHMATQGTPDIETLASFAHAYLWDNDSLENGNMILMQYTGLKDKNGVEIYEGDIVREDGRDRVVVFEQGMYWLDGPEVWGSKHSIALGGALADERQAQSEVIGNIYETPELK